MSRPHIIIIIIIIRRRHGRRAGTVQAGIGSRNFGRVETSSLLMAEERLVVIVNDVFGGHASPGRRRGGGCHRCSWFKRVRSVRVGLLQDSSTNYRCPPSPSPHHHQSPSPSSIVDRRRLLHAALIDRPQRWLGGR